MLTLNGNEVIKVAGKEIKFSIWALDPEISLEQLPGMLELDYSKEIEYLQSIENPEITEFDRTLLHRWREYKQDYGFNIQEIGILGKTVRCIPVLAHLEFPAPRNRAIFGNMAVPRRDRVDSSDLPVFFFEHGGRVYAIVTGPEYKTRYIRSLLMGGGRKPAELHTRWKSVQFKDIPNFNFSSDFFYWLITKENSTINTDNFNMSVSDIRYLAQSADRKDINHESEGANLLDEAMSKTGLGVNSRLGRVGTTITTNEGTHRFILFENGDCHVDNYESAINSPSGDVEPFEKHLEIGALMLFSSILPSLKSAFNTDVSQRHWTTQHQKDSRKEWALGAINELCSENEITLDEISELDWFK